MDNSPFNIYQPGNNLANACCVYDHTTLIRGKDDATVLICPSCGNQYIEKDAAVVFDTDIVSKHKKQANRPIVMTAKKKKKLLSERGEIIDPNDTLAIQDMMEGKRILSYREEQVR